MTLKHIIKYLQLLIIYHITNNVMGKSVSGNLPQIDSPYLDARSDGFACMTGKMNRQDLFAHVNPVKGERSKLSEVASRLLELKNCDLIQIVLNLVSLHQFLNHTENENFDTWSRKDGFFLR
jgi:hypothetical protein